MKKIQINCGAEGFLSLDKITDFQGNLKKRTKSDIEKIITSIEKFGFTFPFFVWKDKKTNYCLDGHGRIQALKQMQQDGYELPEFPVVYIKAKDKAEAKHKLLRLNSQYGTITKDSLLEFTNDIEIDFKELQFSNINLDEGVDNIYTNKITAPIYEPSKKKPLVSTLMDTSKTTKLIKKIQESKVTAVEKAFLITAAYRHVIFDYQKIADYYAHSGKEMQALMEDSALVIIDFKKAIEDGFVRLVKDINAIYDEDYNEE